MADTMTNDILDELLKDGGPVALIVKQPLEPVDSEDPVIFPPTYPVTRWKGRVHTIRDGDYRVDVQLPPDSKIDKDGNRENQKPGYQIDYFPDGTNVCEIDSPQSQSNRIEPKFKTIKDGKLVPQIAIQIGSDKKNLLEIGHRAGDAAVRMSSMAGEFHDAFTAAKKKDFLKLAALAPTSLVFGVWDSRSTYVKQQRIFKAHIRATNVFEMSRSAQFTPAVNYVDAGAIGDDVEKKEGDESNLSQEGMVHALNTQAAGGVMLTEKSRLMRTVNVNLEAIRQLSATAEGKTSAAERTHALQKYILGLALVAAIEDPELNLREGCHLRFTDGASTKDDSTCVRLVYRSKPSDDRRFNREEVQNATNEAKSAFFRLAGINEDQIDRTDVVFEKGVAEKFLAYSQGDRDKIRKLGPITQATLARFETQGKDPFKAVTEELKKVKQELGNKPRGKNAERVVKLDAFNSVAGMLDELAKDETIPDGAAELAGELTDIARQHTDSHGAHKEMTDRIKAYKKALKEGTRDATTDDKGEASA